MKKIAVIVIMVLCITACESGGGGGGGGGGSEDSNKKSITLSGSVFVSINGIPKRYAKVTIYRDSGLTNPLGYNGGACYTAGDYSANDYSIYLSSESTRFPDGVWEYYIYEKFTTPITKVWIKVESCTYGSESEIVEYPLYLFDKD
jgi:hypothetical protein